MKVFKPSEFKPVDGFAVYYIGADWCGPCRQVANEVADLAAEFSSTYFAKIDLSDREDSTHDTPFALVRGIPALAVLENGVLKQLAPYKKATLKAFLEKKKIQPSQEEDFINRYNAKKPTHTIDDGLEVVLVGKKDMTLDLFKNVPVPEGSVIVYNKKDFSIYVVDKSLLKKKIKS